MLSCSLCPQNKAKIKQLFLKYDVDKSQKLDLNELKMLLAELSNRDPSTITTHEVSRSRGSTVALPAPLSSR